MKTKNIIASAVLFMMISYSAEAQFLKKLKKKVEDRVEETIINKTSEEAAKKTDKSLDKVFNPDFSSKEPKEVNKEDVPKYFDFEYKYQLTFTYENYENEIDYFLKPGASYLGVRPSAGSEIDMFTVMDGKENTHYMFMDMEGQKIVKTTSLDVSGSLDDEGNVNVLNDYKITKLPNKTYLGYDCEGVKMENDEYKLIIYFTNEAKISFNDVFKTDPTRIPETMKGFFNDNKNALMMYMDMDMKDKKNKRKRNTSGTMECTLLEPTEFKLKTSGYKFM